MDDSIPHIWTSKGHLPIHSLQHHVGWEVTSTYIKFRDVYMTHQGEIVHESAHVHMLEGVEAAGEAAKFG